MVIATERRDVAVHSAGSQQLPLARVRNVRDLGGYAYRAEDGSQGEDVVYKPHGKIQCMRASIRKVD